MKKNVASQKVGAQLVSATDGSAFTSSVTVEVTLDAGTQATGTVGSGACTHEGNGYHTYAPAQAETNGDLAAFTFHGTGAVPVTVQIYTLPTTGILAPTTAARTLTVDASGRALSDLDTIKTNAVVNGGTFTFPTNATGASTTNITAGTITTTTNLTNLPAITANWLTAAGTAADFGAEIADAVWDEAMSGHTTSFTAGAELQDSYAQIFSTLDATITSRASQTSVDTIDDFVDTEVAAIKAKTDNLPASPAAVGSAMTLTSAYDFSKGTVAVTESYNADGAAPTPVQALMMILQRLTENSVSGVTLTINKLDGTTPAATLTLNDGTSPTAVTRAT